MIGLNRFWKIKQHQILWEWSEHCIVYSSTSEILYLDPSVHHRCEGEGRLYMGVTVNITEQHNWNMKLENSFVGMESLIWSHLSSMWFLSFQATHFQLTYFVMPCNKARMCTVLVAEVLSHYSHLVSSKHLPLLSNCGWKSGQFSCVQKIKL